jgi:hypothetical protein
MDVGQLLLGDGGIDPAGPTIALGVNSRDDYKQRPIEYFADLTNRFIERFDIQL